MARTPAFLIHLVLALALLAGSAAAKQVRIELADGRTITGEFVTETEDQITLRLSGRETRFDKAEVVSQEMLESLTQQFNARRAEIKQGEHDKRYELARWVYDHKTPEGWKLAKRELDSLTADAPDNQQAKLLLGVVVERLRAEAAKENDRTERTNRADRDGRPNARRRPDAAQPTDPEDEESRLISAEDANVIKVMEINLNTRPTVRVSSEAVDKLFKDHRNDPALERFLDRDGKTRFSSLQDHVQLGYIFRVGARDLYPLVKVKDEPKALQDFRTKITARYLVPKCGQCHSEDKDTSFTIITENARREDVAYTNFMTLHLAEADGRRLIDRDRDDTSQSLLIQYGLRPEDAVFPHPEVEGLRPALRNTRDPLYRELVNWIQSLYAPTPDYPIKFRPPGLPAEPDASGSDADAADPPGPGGGDDRE